MLVASINPANQFVGGEFASSPKALRVTRKAPELLS